FEQIRQAAYHRWERRGGGHGRDLDDWTAAEQHLLFAMNYEVVAQYRLDGDPRKIGDAGRRVCRFCEQAAPRATFSRPAPAVPEFLGHSSLQAFDQCDDCRALLAESLEPDFEAFVRPLLAGPAPRGTSPAARPFVPIAAYKCLTRMALSIMPAGEL